MSFWTRVRFPSPPPKLINEPPLGGFFISIFRIPNRIKLNNELNQEDSFMYSYKFKNSERNVPKGSEYETRALLYLISLSSIRDTVENIFIDCFNDVTGTETSYSELYDIQSKGLASLNPKKIGESLITLFQNYLTHFRFTHFILFVQKIDARYLVDNNQNVFGVENFGEYTIKIKQGLIEEYSRRNSDLMGKNILDPLINIFLHKIIVVIDKESKSSYIRSLIKFNNPGVTSDSLLETIFLEIQKCQLTKKTIYIENVEINEIKEALTYKKYINSKELHTLILNRLIGNELLTTSAIPFHFMDIVKNLDSNDVKDLVLECQAKICMSYFDKNGTQDFWSFFECAFSNIKEYPKDSIVETLKKINSASKNNCIYLKDQSGLFLISLIKQGIIDENN